MNVTRAVLPVMRKQRSGHIITISSSAGLVGFEFGAAYAASKFGLEGWMQSLRPEAERFGIKSTVVNPGFFRTELLTKESTNFAPHSIDDYAAGTRATGGLLDGSERAAGRRSRQARTCTGPDRRTPRSASAIRCRCRCGCRRRTSCRRTPQGPRSASGLVDVARHRRRLVGDLRSRNERMQDERIIHAQQRRGSSSLATADGRWRPTAMICAATSSGLQTRRQQFGNRVPLAATVAL